MRFLDEYRNPEVARHLLGQIRSITTGRWTIMEICGGQTHSIVRNGIDQMLPDEIELIHGPGCPVCVTPLEMIDRALAIASLPGVVFTSFGDMLRVPGTRKDLFTVKSEGGDVRIVYSPLDALKIARENPDKQVVFFAIGFETTAPVTAMAVWQAHRQKISNFSMLVSHVLVPPAVEALLSSPDTRIQALLAAGHVCEVQGWAEYTAIAREYRVPVVVTGFEPVDLLEGIFAAVCQLEEGRAEVENRYSRVVSRDGNVEAKKLVDAVFEVCHRSWRGIGEIPDSGLRLRQAYAGHDAERVFDIGEIRAQEPHACISGRVLTGVKKPYECPMFGTTCTPRHPIGATMVSSEGACAAYYSYAKRNEVK